MRLKLPTICFAVAMALAAVAPQARAQATQQQIVNEAFGVVQTFHNPGAYIDNVRALVRRSRAIIIVPNMVKAGFIFGAQGGTGVLLVHNRNGSWSHPAFFNMGAASFGLQAGVSVSKVVLIVMNDRALTLALTNAQLKLGAEAGLAVATLGAGAEGSVTTAGADIYALSSSQGLFGGISLQGGALGPAPDANAAYYGMPLTAEDIVYGRVRIATRSDANLRAALAHL